VRYQRNECNLGVTGNFQKCLDMVKQDHVVVMGSDDIMLPNYVATVSSLLEQFPSATIVQPGVQVIGSDGKPIRTLIDQTKKRIYAPKFTGTVALQGEDLAVSLLRGDWLYFPSLCWRSTAIAAVGFDSRLSVIQDLALILELVDQGAQLVASDELCFQYRRHAISASSATAANGSRFDEAQNFFFEVAGRMENRGWHRAARAARWHLSSRLHALTMLPIAAAQRNTAGLQILTRYAFGSLRS
jgi:Glycosyltransferase like family 2